MRPKALDVLAKHDLRSRLPQTILRAIETGVSGPADASESRVRKHYVLLDNNTALEAAAEAARTRGFIAEIAADISDQPIEEGCEQLLENLEALRIRHRNSSGIVCLISGGEFACPVNGDGMGGRNLETALRLAGSTNLELADTWLCAREQTVSMATVPPRERSSTTPRSPERGRSASTRRFPWTQRFLFVFCRTRRRHQYRSDGHKCARLEDFAGAHPD